MMSKALTTFFNVDGANGQIVMPTPHNDTFNYEAFTELSALSVQDRLNQVMSQLTEAEHAYLAATVVNWCGMALAECSFFDCMRWWSLAGHKADGIDNCAFRYKLACGQTGLARAVFEDCSRHRNFAYSFQTPITGISQRDGSVSVKTQSGQSHRARQLVSSIPWMVLDSIEFDPPLPDAKFEVIRNASCGNSNKIYAEVKGSDWDAWGLMTPDFERTKGIQYFSSTGCTPSGNGRIVSFSLRDGQNRELFPDEEPEATMEAFRTANPELDITRLVS
jgi:monoamine oxidase